MKKYLSLLLALVMVLSLMPAAALTAQAAETSGTCGEKLTWTLENGTLTISGTGAMEDYNSPPWYDSRDAISNVVMEEGVTSIGDHAFYNCRNLISIEIPEGVTRIGKHAFSYCELASVTIPESVTSIGEWAFSGCDMTSVVIPKGVTSIDDYAFYNCPLTGIYVDENNPNYSSDEYGVLFNKDKTILILASRGIGDSYQIPEGVTGIGTTAFCYCSSLTNVVFPESLISIGDRVFEHCYKLTDVVFPESLTSIGDSVFSHCHSLTSILIPENVTSIGDHPFYGCSDLTEIRVDADNPSYSSDEAGVLFNKDKTTLLRAPGAISGSYHVPEGVTSIDEYAFSYCDLTSVTISESVISIGAWAFSGCELASIEIPKNVTSIGYAAFHYCSSLTDVYYGGSEEQWNAITIKEDNEYLTSATIHFAEESSVTPPTEDNAPTTPPAEDSDPTTPAGNPFSDVPAEEYYYAPVLWAVDNGITTGMTATTFVPEDTCTRAQIVTFLWRANGSPIPESSDNPFTDVPADAWYTNAVLWAVEQGITTGMTATTFEPDGTCTRGQVATFLWRAENQPTSASENIFSDLASGAYYYDAVLWAVEKGITNGMGNGTFAPDETCTRGQIVTFLYRAMNP